ncbi:MAG: hypothetical protein ACLUH4_08545 [Alphaproteobacteria bacterium]|jgi:hypothetical protein|uniref:hypothetical protein n=1 Tax=Candidatus Scatocola faecigallinarum TaxID=2840916 RepID=UPI0003402DF2|nr:unknown [Azospirillum sp. CAG:239]
MSENNYLSPVFVNDINERLEKNFSDEEVRKQNFNTIQNIAKNLNIGKKFKVPQAELLYLLCEKNPLELYRIRQISEKFKDIEHNLDGSEDDKNLLCRVLSNYFKEQMNIDPDGLLVNKITETFPKVLDYARDDDITISVFYNTHHETNVTFNKREIIDKFYSVDYGVLVANLGQVKTPIFSRRNLKEAEYEVKRLDIMSQAIDSLTPAKFMLFALHFDKYIEKLPDIDDDLAVGAIKNVVPVIKNGKNKILNSVGNIWGTDISDHGSSGFVFRCLTSRVTPYNITRLCRIAEQIPSSDENRFEQIRLDAIAVNDAFPRLRSYIHNQQPQQHKLLKRMVLYYDAVKGLNPELDVSYRTAKLQRIVNYIEANSPDYNINADDLFNIKKYDAQTRDSQSNQTTNIEVLRRLMNNTTPRTLETPQINDPYTKHLLEELMDIEFPFVRHDTYGLYLQKLNNHLERKMKAGSIGIQPKTINSILWSERRGFLLLQDMDAGYQLHAFKTPWFKEILRFYELTNSSQDTPNSDLNKFLASIKDSEMEEAYIKISHRISNEIVALTQRQKKDAMEYSQYIGKLNISDGEKEKQQKKIKDSLDIKVGRNLSGYSLANALFNCISPKRTPYKALADYMKRRQESRTGIVIRDYLIKKQHR